MIDPARPDFTNTPVSPQRPRFNYIPSDPSVSPCVTIVTPFYNTGAIFHETARTVLQQSLQQWEWLIVNDGSTNPEARAILDVYRGRDPRIRVIDHTVNKGLSGARNTGFRAATAPYVLQLDSDDLLEPTAAEKWLWFLESYPEFAFAKGYSVGFDAQEYLWDKGFHNGTEFLEQNLVAPSSVIRTAVHAAVDGYDETNRAGLEDWDFWCRCATAGFWGGTVPEYLDWYRRRPTHQDRWTNWDHGERQRAFREGLQQKYSSLWNGEFPRVLVRGHLPHDHVPTDLPWPNRLKKKNPRLLMLLPWLAIGGADKFNLDMLGQLSHREWEVTIATTLKGEHPWLSSFASMTPDIFILDHFLRLVDYPRFLRYLIASRQIDTVLISHSELGYQLLPYLRAYCPDVTFVDYCHIEEEQWKNGGYPRQAVEYQAFIDLNLVSSAHLKGWMEKQGADPQRIAVCHTNIDSEQWRPDSGRQKLVRQEFNLDTTTPVILYAARLCAQKQPRVFARTMLQLAERKLQFVTFVAGGGEEFAWLQSFIHQHKLETRVRLCGAVSNERIRELLSGAALFFLPSQWEGIALSVYEAMACGVAVVSADVGGQRELLTPECGVLIPRGDEDAEVTRYVEVLSALLQDRECCRAMGEAGRKRVQTHFRLEQMGERLLALIGEAEQYRRTHADMLPSARMGQLYATQVVEYHRLQELADGLWQQRGRSSLHPYLLDPQNDSWRTLAYFAVRRLFLATYQRVLGGNWRFLRPLKRQLKKILLGIGQP